MAMLLLNSKSTKILGVIKNYASSSAIEKTRKNSVFNIRKTQYSKIWRHDYDQSKSGVVVLGES